MPRAEQGQKFAAPIALEMGAWKDRCRSVLLPHPQFPFMPFNSFPTKLLPTLINAC